MKPLTARKNIESLTYQVDHVNVNFKNSWYQEDIEVLVELLFSPIMPVTIQEKTIGADRENIRFSWADSYFVLNFDYYSQSCWIEGQDDTSTRKLSNLHLAITR